MNRQNADIDTDEHLVEICQITKNLKENVSAINSSLDHQSKIVKDISTNMEKTQKKMNFVMDKLGTILKTKDNKQLYTIVVLWLVLMVQIFLLIFT